MDLELTGRVAVIGGASKGLGRACADSLAHEGAQLALCSRNPQELQTAAAEIRAATSAEVIPIPADLSQPDGIRHLIHTAAAHYGRLDILIANSGGPPEGRPLNTTEETWQRAIDLALSFFIRAAREAAPYMQQQQWAASSTSSPPPSTSPSTTS